MKRCLLSDKSAQISVFLSDCPFCAGMIWSGFRPSDDANKYGYSIPSNIYAAAALQRALEINQAIWHNEEFKKKASKLLRDVESGMFGMDWYPIAPPSYGLKRNAILFLVSYQAV